MHAQPQDLKSNTAARLMSIAAIRARMSMLAVAYSARLGAVNMRDIEAAAAQLDGVFGADHDLTHEMRRFVSELPALRRYVPNLAAAGDRLIRAVERTTWPDADARADIHG
ncbi:hypothetical protein pthi1_p17 [Paracoccus phage vB_PthS_Pthi1]|uniref:Uncharacterized protein n=1 Tax=Paracoccus thiocyanatus TaxID=34006 RepID=A0A1N6SGJ8_9RHOB|nr:hypothetical protein [Paracoccus thiocyanatus]AZV00382.1 hypothetical protein pthi1_p17 [Paracoccus phage vB_PthS_Pthi1]SIQ40201.1 hypothetical protein SAMN05421641_107104 [Paracoccus thiocyanatus]